MEMYKKRLNNKACIYYHTKVLEKWNPIIQNQIRYTSYMHIVYAMHTENKLILIIIKMHAFIRIVVATTRLYYCD